MSNAAEQLSNIMVRESDLPIVNQVIEHIQELEDTINAMGFYAGTRIPDELNEKINALMEKQL